MNIDHELDNIIKSYREARFEIDLFMGIVSKYIFQNPKLNDLHRPHVHSYKARLKDETHLVEKVKRKWADGRIINAKNLFDEVTDLAGVRILHLFQAQFEHIDAVIRRKVEIGDWFLHERPRAYTWDPESASFFSRFDLDITEKSSAYTSVHYLIKPRQSTNICCEVQVRTLFEEIWGEVDHQMNYPTKSANAACGEQLRVLSKIVGAGSRLLDSLDRLEPRPD